MIVPRFELRAWRGWGFGYAIEPLGGKRAESTPTGSIKTDWTARCITIWVGLFAISLKIGYERRSQS